MAKRTVIVITGLVIAVMIYQTQKPLPAGVSVEGEQHMVPDEAVRFLADRTYVDSSGKRHSEQEIFNEVLHMIERAQEYILVDMFLYNEFQGSKPERTRALARELTQELVAKKQANPDMKITVVSDPLNEVYGGVTSLEFEALRKAGIPVVVTDLTPLRDSNPLYSVWWRLVFQWFGNSERGGILPHPFQAGGPKVTARSWLSLLNFKANHRKLVVADRETLVTSANPHNGSSAHSNVALQVKDKVWQDVVASEAATAKFSGQKLPDFEGNITGPPDGGVKVQLLTEGAIQRRLVEMIDAADEGDVIDMAMFYLAERSVIRSLIAAAQRGVAVRLVLDPNKDAFGHTKNGVPNRPVADEIMRKTNNTVQIRWCDTHGEQCHNKMVVLRAGSQHAITLGSANLTRRNIRDYNLETNLLASAEQPFGAWQTAHDWFEEIWTNRDGKIFTTDYAAYAEASWLKTAMYRVQEAWGLSSF